MTKSTTLERGALEYVTTYMREVKETADANTSAVSQTDTNLAQLANLINQSLNEIIESVNQIIDEKAEKPNSYLIQVPVTSWVSNPDSSSPYPYIASIVNNTFTATMLVKVNFSAADMEVLKDCEMSPSCKVETSKVTLYAKTAPTSAITAQVWTEDAIASGTDTTVSYGFVNVPPSSGAKTGYQNLLVLSEESSS